MNLFEFSTIILLIIAIMVICITIVVPTIDKAFSIKDRQVKNDLYTLYMNIDPDLIQAAIDHMIDLKLSEYILINITTRENQYMNSTDIDKMIKTVSAEVYLNLSDLYITYIKMLVEIKTDDDLMIYVNKAVKMRSIDLVKNNNELK